ncbi:hypothetical protein D9M71_482330 [compost metagenome]
MTQVETVTDKAGQYMQVGVAHGLPGHSAIAQQQVDTFAGVFIEAQAAFTQGGRHPLTHTHHVATGLRRDITQAACVGLGNDQDMARSNRLDGEKGQALLVFVDNGSR